MSLNCIQNHIITRLWRFPLSFQCVLKPVKHWIMFSVSIKPSFVVTFNRKLLILSWKIEEKKRLNLDVRRGFAFWSMDLRNSTTLMTSSGRWASNPNAERDADIPLSCLMILTRSSLIRTLESFWGEKLRSMDLRMVLIILITESFWSVSNQENLKYFCPPLPAKFLLLLNA